MKKRLMVIITAAMLICSLNAYAEMVYLKDGQVISGKIISEDQLWITVQNKYQTVRFKRSEIKRIMYGDRKMEEVYIELASGDLLKGYMVDQDAVKVFYKSDKNAQETTILKSTIARMSSQPFVPIDLGLMLRSGVFYPFSSGNSSLGAAPVILSSAGINLPVKNLRLIVETGYYNSKSTEHDDQYMFFVPVTGNLVYDFSFGNFHLLPKLGAGAAVVKFDDGEGSDASGGTFNFVAGAGCTYQIIKRRLNAGLWLDYNLIADTSAAYHGVMATLSVEYRF